MSEIPITSEEAAAHVVRSFHPEARLPEGPQLASLYREVLHDRRVLLFLDNAADRDQVVPLLPPDRCATLVTSRRRFSLPGAFRLDLDQLPANNACELLRKYLAIARETGDRRGEGNALGNLGNAYAELGLTRRAIDLFGQDLAIRRELGDRRGEGNALGNLGTAYADLGEVREAIDLYRQRIDIAREIGDRRGAANARWNLGAAYEKLGEIAQAIDSMQACVDFEREIGHPDAEKDAAHVEELRARAGG